MEFWEEGYYVQNNANEEAAVLLHNNSLEDMPSPNQTATKYNTMAFAR